MDNNFNNDIYDPNNTNRKRRKPRVFSLILAGALIGSVLGGGAVGLYLDSQTDPSLTASAQDYIEETVAAELASYSDDSTVIEIGTDTEDETTESTSYSEITTVTTDYSSAVQSVAETVMPSVVGVRTIETVEMFRQSTEVEGIGTGIIVSSDGLILTNQHVVSEDPSSITVTLIDGSEYPAEILYSDESMDLAIIKIDATGLTAAELGDSDSLSVGEVAIAIGNPLGLEYERSVTAGIVSALDRSILVSTTQIAENLIQTDAAINSGNSGGPLLNASGQVIGINTYKLSDGEGMGFAIPINAAIPIIEQILETGEFQQVQLGVSIMDQELLYYYEDSNITLDYGVYVYNIDTTSNAYAAGLRSGDIITEVNGVSIDTMLELKEQLYQHVPGDVITLTIERDGTSQDIDVTLEAAD